MTKIEIPTEVAEEIVAETARRNGDNPRAAGQPRAGKGGKERGKRLDSLVDGVTRNLFETLSETKRRQDYGLFLQVTDRLIQVAELEARRLEELGHA
jgi:hypothetical protein